ncbi:hypothetical protein HF086_000510 [Spodoptera exigua]|uniref:Nuclear pore complex protein Nup205 n=1 Tax=Spodoptera exigua TaxID=7107 RepID=A0A922MQB6_SPOEX|nr:hypothetical protein HF086_000510 [Spodoptera exigua]
MDINEGTTADDLWTPFKELVSVVEGYLAHEGKGAPYAVHTFETVLRRHKQTFLSLFKNPAKNASSREEIRRGITEGVTLPSIGRTLLSKELVEEAIIISDMYNVSEYLALELLHTAQRQSPRHPGLPRGLVAVLLYYDGRRALVQALKELVMARDGVCWSINAREEIISYVSRYVEQLISDGLLSNALDSLRRFTLEVEMELLQNNRALPPGRHHVTLVSTIETTRKLLAGVVFAASAQKGLSRDIILRIIAEQTTSPTQGPTGALDEISLALQMALLYALDLSVLHRREDGEELAKKLPLIQDPELISVLLDELSGTPAEQGRGAGVRALCQLSLGLALAALKRAPQSLLRRTNSPHLKCELLDQDEMLVDAAIDGKVFEYLDEAILSTDFVAKEEYYQRRIHTLITDFIVLMHSKLMEMRVKADEAARAVSMYAAEGLAAPAGAGAGRTRLDALLRCVERLYARDPLRLRRQYWDACGGGARGAGRAATLYKFVRLSGEVLCGALLAGYLRALASLAVPKHTWALLAKRDALSAYHLLTALARYHSNLRADPAPFSEHAHASSLGASAIVTPAARPGKMLVRQEEVEALIAALKLIASVAREDHAACAAICENLQWDAVNVMFGLICCHIPLQLKAELCLTLAALGSTPATAGRVWAALEAAQLVSTSNEKRALNAELHEMLSLCFRLFARWLEAYEPSPSDFPAPGREADTNPPPGFRLLLQLHTKSELLRLLLTTLEEAHDLLEKHPQPATRVRVVTLDGPAGVRGASAGELPAGGGARAGAGACAAGRRRRRGPRAHARAALQAYTRYGFVECLEAEEWSEPSVQAEGAGEGGEGVVEGAEGGNYVRQAKEGVLLLLQHVLPTAPPNLAHFLLGYNLSDDNASVVSLSARSWVVRACACEAGAAAAGRQHAALSALLTALTHTAHHPTQRLCVCVIGLGGKRISVSRVHALLTRELAALHATAPQRNLVATEIQKVLDYVTEVNRQRNLAATLTHYYDSWRQLTEILFCVAPHDILPLESRKNLLLNILQDLLNKIPPAEVLPQLGNLASGTVLLLLVNLRHCYLLQKRETNQKSSEFEMSFFGPSNQIMQTNSLTLKFILHKILSWILVSGGSTQKMRVNLYGALLNYLNIVNLKTSPADPEEENMPTTYVSRLDSSKARPSREESALKSMVIDVISDFGENLCSIVCGDCIGAGHDVCRMVALACLDTLIEINPRTDWVNTLTNQGYLRSLIDSLLQDDEGLKETLEPNPKSLRVLYVYESKMGLLLKLAGTRAGAETLLAQGALACLAGLSALAAHPDIHTGYASHKDTEFVPSVANRAAHPNSPVELLIEVEAITSVIGRASNREVFGGAVAVEPTALQASAAAAQRIVCNLLTYARNIMCDSSGRCVGLAAAEGGAGGAGAEAGGAARLLALLQHLARAHAHHDKLLATTRHQLHNLPTMSLDDMRKLLPEESSSLSPVECRSRAVSVLGARVRTRRAELGACAHALDCALHLLWAHTRVLLRAGLPTDDNDNSLLNATGAWRGSGDDLPELRKELIAVFNDRFTEQLLDTTKNQPQVQRSFFELLVKDIKTMVQFSPL